MPKETFFTKDIHTLQKYWNDEKRALRFLKGGTRVDAIDYLLRRIEVDVHKGSWLDSGTGAGFIQSQIDLDVSPTLFVGLDFSVTMLLTQENPYGERVAGSNLKTPFRDASFTIVTNIFSLSDYPNIEPTFMELERTIAKSGTFIHLDYAKGDEYWEMRKLLHDTNSEDGNVIVGNINLRSLEQIATWMPKNLRITHQIYLEFNVNASELKTKIKLPKRISRRFIFSEFYKPMST